MTSVPENCSRIDVAQDCIENCFEINFENDECKPIVQKKWQSNPMIKGKANGKRRKQHFGEIMTKEQSVTLCD